VAGGFNGVTGVRCENFHESVHDQEGGLSRWSPSS
jgi:hypothetical protein